jgi:phosphinothricin acetyltransferase
MIRPARSEDARSIAVIYNHYVVNTTATFEEEPVPVAEIGRRLEAVCAAGHPWLVEESMGRIVGYAYASAWNPRSAYRYAAEVTVYVAPDHNGLGTGTRLYQALLDRLREKGCRVVIAVITLPNPASVALHEKFGMTQAGEFQRVGYKFGRWLNVGYWQLELSS